MQIQDTSNLDVVGSWGGFMTGLILLATDLSPVFAVASFLVAIGFTLHKWIIFASIKRERSAIAALRGKFNNNGVLDKEKERAGK